MDVRLVDHSQNITPITAATIEPIGKRNPLHVMMVNISGDAYNAGGGAASNVNLNQVAGNSTSVGSGTTDSGTLRVVVASDETLPVSIAGTVNVSGTSSANPVGVSGDVSTIPKAGQTWPVSVAGTVNVSGTSSANPVGVSGDVSTFQKGAWATAVTGDVLLRSNPNTVIGQLGGTVGVNVIGGMVGARISASGDLTVREQSVIGVQIIGGGINRVSISGDVLAVSQSGGWVLTLGGITAPVGVTGDVSTTPKAGQTWQVREQGVIGVQVIGGSGGGTVGVSGDVQSKQSGAWAISVTGDVAIRQDSTNTPKGTLSTPIGVNIIGGSAGGRVSISGDTLLVNQQGAWALSVTGDVLLRANPSVVIGQIGNILGVNIIGGSIGAQVSPSGDFPVRIATQTIGLGVTGDVSTKPASGQTWPVKEQNVIGVTLLGFGGGADRIGISGDAPVSQKGGWAVAVTGDVALRQNSTNTPIGTLSTPVGVNVVGGSVGGRVSISGDSLNVVPQGVIGIQLVGASNGMDRIGISGDAPVSQKGGWAVAITGDVLIRQNATNTPIGTLSTVVGVQIVGGQSGGSIGVSGDVQNKQAGAWGVAITGDVLLRQLASNTPIGTLSTPIGVQVVGGAVGGAVGISGDVSIKPSTATAIGRFPVSGDTGISDGVTRSTLATVKAYTNANPLAVVLVNSTGDVYSPTPKEPICSTIPFRVASAGTTTIAGPYNGRVIKVTAFSLQAESDNTGTTQCRFGSAASGSALTHDWMFNPREGVIQAVSPIGGGYIFKTLLNQALVLENSGDNVRGSVTFTSGDSV